MTAIKIAAEIFNHKQSQSADSLSSIQSLSSRHFTSNPNILTNTLNALNQTNSRTSVIWVPNHIRIQGNESADKLATLAVAKPVIDIQFPFELRHINQLSAKVTRQKWNETWKS
jgi:ribonuclease HI